MQRLHETVDHHTGDTYHVETTRQAKRRYQRSGPAQFKPTVGQINAADLWNKQEEKIRRDKEREERRKKNKVKQDVKDARQKEIQQEMLRKGKISIEDTWGRVNASQNRLHKFFAAHPPCPETHLTSVGSGRELVSIDGEDQTKPVIAEETVLYQPVLNASFFENVDDFFTGSPLSPNAQRPSIQSDLKLVKETTIPSKSDNLLLIKSPLLSSFKRKLTTTEDSMPPPKRPTMMSDGSEIVTAAYASPDKVRKSPALVSRSPLSEMSPSQVNIRACEKSSPHIKPKRQCDYSTHPTQILRDTLSGLCTQDLIDDLTDDEKENRSPLPVVPAQELECDTTKHVMQNVASRVQNADNYNLDDGYESIFDDISGGSFNSDEFDDEGIDDDSLLSIAATQQLKNNLFTRSNDGQQRLQPQESNINPLADLRDISDQIVLSTTEPKIGDSFAMDGLNDNDLLQGLQDFESDTQTLATTECDYARDMDQLTKKGGRNLPWIKNPVRYESDHETSVGCLTPSPLSQPYSP